MAERLDLDELLEKKTREARLIPVVSGEMAVTSVVLAAMARVRPFAEAVLRGVQVREKELAKSAEFSAYTEIVIPKTLGMAEARFDGLIRIRTPRGKPEYWTAIVESKTAANGFDDDQMSRYIEIARAYGVDCIMTLSNHLVVDPAHLPYQPKLPRGRQKVVLRHSSWSNLRRLAAGLLETEGRGALDDAERYILGEMVGYMNDAKKGAKKNAAPEVVDFLGMHERSWNHLVETAKAGDRWTPKDEHVERVVRSWSEAERYLSWELSELTGKRVVVKDAADRKLKERYRATTKLLKGSRRLSSTFEVKGGPGDITVDANLGSRDFSVWASVSAPATHRPAASERIGWLMDQFAEAPQGRPTPTEHGTKLDRRRVLVQAVYGRPGPGERPTVEASLAEALATWKALDLGDPNFSLTTFVLKMRERDSGAWGATAFPLRLRRLLEKYCQGVYQYIQE